MFFCRCKREDSGKLREEKPFSISLCRRRNVNESGKGEEGDKSVTQLWISGGRKGLEVRIMGLGMSLRASHDAIRNISTEKVN
jgi:hypothetical protein